MSKFHLIEDSYWLYKNKIYQLGRFSDFVASPELFAVVELSKVNSPFMIPELVKQEDFRNNAKRIDKSQLDIYGALYAQKK